MSMTLVHAPQGTQAWHDLRAQYRCASETPCVLGFAQYAPKTHKHLARLKRGLDAIADNPAMARGRRLEDGLRKLAEDIVDEPLMPSVGVKDKYLASFDGITLDGDAIIEIKTGGAKLAEQWKAGEIPEHHQLQVQHQLMVSGADACFYIGGDEDGIQFRREVSPDPTVWADIHDAWEEFWPLMSADPEDLEEIVERIDEDWCNAMADYRAAKALEAATKKDVEKCKARLVELADGESSQGGGGKLIHIARKGSVQYKEIPELNGLNLDQYRKEPSGYWQVNLDKTK